MSSFEWRSIYPTTQWGNSKGREHQRTSPQVEAAAWLRDEPMDTDTGDDHFPFAPAALVDGLCGGPSERSEEKMKSGGSQCLPKESFPSGRSSGLSGDYAAQLQGWSAPASLHAQLRSAKMKECVKREAIQPYGTGKEGPQGKHIIRDAIQPYGTGKEGLQGIIKDIMLRLQARNRNNSPSGDLCSSQSESRSPAVEQIDHLPWSDVKPRIVVDVQSGSIGNFNHALPADLKFMMNATSSFRDDGRSLCNLATECSSRGEYGQVPSAEDQRHLVIDEPGRCGLLSGLRLQESGLPQEDVSSLSSWSLAIPIVHDGSENCAETSSPDLSPDCSGLHIAHDRAIHEDNLTHRNKSGRRSPFPTGFSSSQSSTKLPVYGSDETPPVSEIGWIPAIFGSVEANYPISPGDHYIVNHPQSPPIGSNSSDLTMFGMHRSILIDSDLGRGVPADAVYGCDLVHKPGYSILPVISVDRKKSGAPLDGVIATSKAGPGACRWMVRKNRMRSHRAVSRDAFQSSGHCTGKTGRMQSSGSLRTLPRRGSPAAENQACWTDDWADQEHLQFLLQKVLKPSDVGNLGRIVLPKELSENHLPWLGSKEGVKFYAKDYDTGETINLRYRFWPNNKSRMYVLENTGGFVRKHNLQESDSMLIYKYQQQGIYVIRARKARDYVPIARREVQRAEMMGDGKEFSKYDSQGDHLSGTSSCDKVVETPESKLCSRILDGPLKSVETSPDDFLILDSALQTLLDKGTENPVQFLPLGSF